MLKESIGCVGHSLHSDGSKFVYTIILMAAYPNKSHTATWSRGMQGLVLVLGKAPKADLTGAQRQLVGRTISYTYMRRPVLC